VPILFGLLEAAEQVQISVVELEFVNGELSGTLDSEVGGIEAGIEDTARGSTNGVTTTTFGNRSLAWN